MARIPEETLQAIRDRVDLVDLIGRYVNLKKAGRNFVGLCPFHQEKTPSFNVNVERQIFHCFGCGEGGNCFGFLTKHENLTFPEAARTLAREVGVEIPESAAPGERGEAERLRAANQAAQDLYREALAHPKGESARAYLEGRGIGPDEAEQFGIGFAPASGRALFGRLEREKIPRAVGEKAGLVKSGRELLRDRITFPIQDARGQVVGFGGRDLSGSHPAKYLNTPESPIYRKREVFYGLHLALAAMRKHERAVVVEGYFDRIAMHRAGVEEAVATCGTSLTQEHARALRRRTGRVVLVFDGDEAGQKAVESSLEVLLPEGLRVDAVLLPDGNDPDDLLAAEGAEALCRRVDEAEPALDLVIRRAMARGCSTPWEKADAVAAIAPLLALLPEAVARAEWVRRLAMMVDTDAAAVEQAVRAARRGGEREALEALPAAPRMDDRRVRWAEDLLAALLADPALAGAEPLDALRALLPESPQLRALELAVSVAGAAGAVDVAALEAGGGDEEALAVLRRLALADRFQGEPESAARVFHDVVSALRRVDERERGRHATRSYDASQGDPHDFLAAKQRELERRRMRAQSPSGLDTV